MELLLIPSLLVVSKIYNTSIPKYTIFGVIAIHGLIFTIKHKFVSKIGGRILYVLGELCLVAVLYFFLFEITYLKDYHLDLFLVSGVLFFDLIFYISLIGHHCKYGLPSDEV